MIESQAATDSRVLLLEEQLGDLEHALEQNQAQLLQSGKMATVGQLAAGVAHEINNPLGFVSSNMNTLNKYLEGIFCVLAQYAELLGACEGHDTLQTHVEAAEHAIKETQLDFLCDDMKALVSECLDGLERMQRIVADLRDFSHVDSPEAAEEDINALLDKSINLGLHELKYKAEIVREYSELPPLSCFGMQLAQCFLNLLVNAAHAIPKFGTVTIRTGVRDGNMFIEIEDDGGGISEADRERIFEPFFTTKEVGKGTGLGLPMVRRTVEAHGGVIEVKSALGTGTVFRITIPETGVELDGPASGAEEEESSHVVESTNASADA